MNKGFSCGIVLLLMVATGCITRAGGALGPIEVVPPPTAPRLEQTVGDLACELLHLGAGETALSPAGPRQTGGER